ncbi:MAG: hypothetical protein B6D35_11920 [Candidatus Brocadia sp. UTAMX2]|jgi:hypothetical protein|nr:MAG: hypothetical protein B6D35_11920 [Candidatus Brocadia sp. UTAMX2]
MIIMTQEERIQKIESYGKGHLQLTEALKQFPKTMWSFKPSPDRWSIHEIIIHIADSEANAYVKCRKLIAEPGKSIAAYDQDKWSAALHYRDQNTEEALELFRRLRLSSYALIKALPESVWSDSVGSMENETATLDNWLEVYEQHIPGHISQMKKRFVEWQKKRSD